MKKKSFLCYIYSNIERISFSSVYTVFSTDSMISIFIFALILYIIAYMSGAKTFIQVFKYVFTIFFVVNLYDLLIMDLLIFRNIKKFRIPGTEDMDKEYKECWHHIRGFFIGIGIGIIVSLISTLYIQIFNII